MMTPATLDESMLVMISGKESMVPSTAMEETRARTVSKSNTFLLPLRNCVGMLKMTATKAVTQKRMVKVAMSRKITRKGSTKTQMTVGRMARERRWIKHVKVQRTSKRIANGHGHVPIHSLNDIAFGAPCEDSGWSSVLVAVMHCAIIMPSRQTDPTSTSLTIMNGVRFNLLDDIPSTSKLISNATIEALHAVTTKKAAQIKECHHHWFCLLSVFSTIQI